MNTFSFSVFLSLFLFLSFSVSIYLILSINFFSNSLFSLFFFFIFSLPFSVILFFFYFKFAFVLFLLSSIFSLAILHTPHISPFSFSSFLFHLFPSSSTFSPRLFPLLCLLSFIPIACSQTRPSFRWTKLHYNDPRTLQTHVKTLGNVKSHLSYCYHTCHYANSCH